MYYSHEFSLEYCPECQRPLIAENCTILLIAGSDKEEGEFLTNLTGSHFCEQCPVVVFDSSKVEQAAMTAIRDGTVHAYAIAGIVDLDAVPEEKKYLELGTDENPLPFIHFLPELPGIAGKYSLNDPCPCGSGKKYKRCCGAGRSRQHRRRR